MNLPQTHIHQILIYNLSNFNQYLGLLIIYEQHLLFELFKLNHIRVLHLPTCETSYHHGCGGCRLELYWIVLYVAILFVQHETAHVGTVVDYSLHGLHDTF